METSVKNWKLYETCVNVSEVITAIKSQSYKGHNSPYAARSASSGRFITSLAQSDRLSIEEIEGSWALLVPDYEKENMTKEVASLMKNSNWCGLSYQCIDRMNIYELWKAISEKIESDDKLIHKTAKIFFENKLYIKN